MRQIEPKLVKWLDEKLKSNGLAQKAIETKDARTVFRLAAEACVGIKETSPNSGPMIELFQETIGSADKESWCMGFAQSMLAYAEKKTGIKSPVFPSELCTEVWNKTPKSQRVKKIPAPGAITIWQRGSTYYGHTGICLEYMGTKFVSLEGNTSDSNMSNGDCVAIKTRSSKATGSLKVLGWLRPF